MGAEPCFCLTERATEQLDMSIIFRFGMALWWTLVRARQPGDVPIHLGTNFSEHLDALYRIEVELVSWDKVCMYMLHDNVNEAYRDSAGRVLQDNFTRFEANRAAEKKFILHLAPTH